MTNPYGDRGAPTALLIVFIVGILFFGVLAYVVYTNAAGKEMELKATLVKIEKDTAKRDTDAKALKDLFDAMGFHNTREADQLYANSAVPADCTTVKLEQFLENKFAKKDAAIKAIGVDPKALDEKGQSAYLETTIGAARRAAVVPDNLKSTTVGDLIDQLIRFDKASTARVDYITQGEEAVKTADAAIKAKLEEIKTKFGDLDKQAGDAWAARLVEENKIRTDKPGWDAELAKLDADLSEEKSINKKFEERLKAQKDLGAPADGAIVSYDWQTRRGTVNLGASDRVKPGYEFSVYTTRPGGDTAENRVYRGRIKLLDVGAESSLFSVIPSNWDAVDKPIMEGQRVTSAIYDNTRRKNFCLKGWFKEGGDYSKKSLAGMIFRDGGHVQDDLTLDTDYLVVGTIDEEGLTNLTPEAKAAIAEGKTAYDQARRYFVTVLTVEKLLKYWDNGAMEVEK